jgi:hypothetical protein
MFLIGIIGGGIATLILIGAADIVLRSGETVRALMMGGLASLVAGITLTLMNVGAGAGLGADTVPGLYQGIGWIAFAPDWVRAVAFVVALALFIAAGLVKLATGLFTSAAKLGLALGDTIKRPLDRRAFGVGRVTPIDVNRTPANVRAIEGKFRLSKQEPEGIDIELPKGKARKRAK